MVSTVQVQLDCEPCIDRTSYTIKAILHGTSDDDYWQKLAASARQSALDMRVHLELELYPPGGYSEERMASEIRAVSDNRAATTSGSYDALLVTIPSQVVANAVRYASQRGMPVFGLNSGFEEVSGRGGMAEEGSVLFFTAMNERLGGEKAAQYFIKDVVGISTDNEDISGLSYAQTADEVTVGEEIDSIGEVDIWTCTRGNDTVVIENNDMISSLATAQGEINIEESGTGAAEEDITISTNAARNLMVDKYFHALFISPLGEKNSAYKQRHDGFRDELLVTTNRTGAPIEVEWFEVDFTTQTSTMLSELTDKMSGCKYQMILVGKGTVARQVVEAVEANGCHLLDVTTKTGTFDASTPNFDLLAEQRLDFIIDQHNHMQGWSPVHFAALFVSTGLVLTPPPDGVYLSGPAFFSKSNTISDTLRICTDEAFPVCPNINGPDGLPSDCQCTDRKKIIIGGVVHGITTDSFWDTVFEAAEQGSNDMGVTLDFNRFEPQESNEILFRRMSAKILSLCQGGEVDGLFISISDEIVANAVRACLELNVPVMSINAGSDTSKELNLIHHVGMVEYNAGYQAGIRMATLASFTRAFCLNHVPGLSVTVDRCSGFEKALLDLGIEYGGEVGVADDNMVQYRTSVESAVGLSGDWAGQAFLLAGSSQVPAAMELKQRHDNFVMASFDTSEALYDALESGDLLFGIDQQAYLQGYLPIPILTHAVKTKQFFLDHAIESGPSFVISPPNSALAACTAVSPEFPVCPEVPVENYNYINDGLIVLGIIFFAVQALASVSAIVWMGVKRKHAVVQAGQPEFLALVAIGCLMLASAILPLSIQGEYRYERDAITLEEGDTLNDHIHLVDAACMAVPWLVCIGFVLVYSALLAKMRRIKEIMTKAQQFRRVQVPRGKVAMTIVCLLAAMLVILITWQLVSPLVWVRDVTEIDPFTGYPTESIGRCTSEHFAAFAGTCAIFMLFCLVYALVLCYQTRSMPLEFSESKYITASVFFILQLLVLGVPILVIARENTNSQFIVLSLIIFLMSFGTTLLIFVPKYIAVAAHRSIVELIQAATTQTPRSGTLPSQSPQSTGQQRESVQDIRARVELRRSQGDYSTHNVYNTVATSTAGESTGQPFESTHNRDCGLDNVVEDASNGSVKDEKRTKDSGQSSEGQASDSLDVYAKD